MAEKRRILVIGATGYIGKYIVEASAKLGHPTFALVRETTIQLKEKLKTYGICLPNVQGDLCDFGSLVRAIKLVDVVISTVGSLKSLEDQVNIIAAIKEAGNVKRFFPSEFGNDVDRTHAVDIAKTLFETKIRIRRTIEAEGIPYTYVCNFYSAGHFLPSLLQIGATVPRRERVVILGDGNKKVVFNKEEDFVAYTIKAVDDSRTLNKILYVKPSKNIYTQNDLAALWEEKIGKNLERIYMPEEQVLKNIQEGSWEEKKFYSMGHCVLLKGDQTYFEIEASFGVEASELYPEVKYTTVDEFLDQFV